MVVTVNVDSDSGITVIFVKALNVPSCRTTSVDTSVTNSKYLTFRYARFCVDCPSLSRFSLYDHISCRGAFREKLTVPALLE
jgi:hypothetical protein